MKLRAARDVAAAGLLRPSSYGPFAGGPRVAMSDTDADEEFGELITSGGTIEHTLFGQTTPHKHRRAQLIYIMSGVITVEVDGSVWTVPPRCAFWLPGGVIHSGGSAGHVKVGKLYIEPSIADLVSKTCGIMLVRPLLRELITHFIEHPAFPPEQAERENRLIDVLVDELQNAPVETLHLPMPKDRRLTKLASAQFETPSLSLTLDEWGLRLGASSRTLSRLFQRETGMSFFRWRQQLHIGIALQRLAEDARVSNIAVDLGYESTSAFIAMFRKITGTTPARYFSESRLQREATTISARRNQERAESAAA